MGFEGLGNKPAEIKKAIIAGNTEFLRAAGVRGAEARNEKRALREDLAAALSAHSLERRAAEDRAMLEDANEHIITPNGEDLDYFDNE